MTHATAHYGHAVIARYGGCTEKRNNLLSEKYPQTGRHILLIQHNRIELGVMEAMLRVLGYRVTTAGEVDQAIVCFSQEHPDLIISELDMPVLSGFRLAQRIKIHAPGTRIVLLTARCQAEVANFMDFRVVDGWLFKPFQLQVLGDMLLRLEQRGVAEQHVEQ